MGFLSSKIDLLDSIKYLENKVSNLEAELGGLKEKNEQLENRKNELETKYVNTGRECGYCYATVGKDYVYCPYCGKKVPKTVKRIPKADRRLFETEPDGENIIITKYIGFDDKKVVIPGEIDGKRVVCVWNNAFELCKNIEEIVFEEGCKYIGEKAFDGCCNLKKVRLPKSLVEIGNWAFSFCGIMDIAIPPNVKNIGDSAFAHNSKLKKVILPQGMKYISRGLFYFSHIEEINIPESVMHIGTNAFSFTEIKSIVIPEDVVSVGDEVFKGMKYLEDVTIHSNVKTIGKDVFRDVDTSKLTIYCSAGSEAQSYARKNGIKICEIPPVEAKDAEPLNSLTVVKFSSVEDRDRIWELYLKMGFSKAEMWSWKKDRLMIIIDKYTCLDELNRLRDIFYTLTEKDAEENRTEPVMAYVKWPNPNEMWREYMF